MTLIEPSFLEHLAGDSDLIVSKLEGKQLRSYAHGSAPFCDEHSWFVSPGVRYDTGKLLSAGRRGGRNDVESVAAIWLDFDLKDGAYDWKELASRWVRPSLIVESGGGHHFWWLLNKPCISSQWLFSKLLRIFPEADTAPANSAAMMRLPGSMNHKYDPPRRCRPVENGGKVYSIAELVRLDFGYLSESLQQLGGSVVSKDSEGRLYVARPGDSDNPHAAVIYPADDVEEWGHAYIFSTNWPALAEGSYRLEDLTGAATVEVSATLPDPDSAEIRRLAKLKHLNHAAEVEFTKTLLDSLGQPFGESMTRRELETILQQAARLNVQDFLSSTGELDPALFFKNANTILAEVSESQQWLVDNLMGVGDLTKLSAEAKSGKTSLVMTLIIALASGRRLWNRDTLPECLKIGVLDFEMRGHELKHRYLKALPEQAGENIYLMLLRESGRAGFDLLSEQVQARLREQIQDLQIDYLVIDPLANAVYKSPAAKLSDFDPMNDNSLMSRFMEAIESIKPWAGALVVHHTNQAGLSRGAKVLDDLPSANWVLTSQGFDKPKTLNIKSRSAGAVSLQLLYNPETSLLDSDVVTTLDFVASKVEDF